jgi:hypothetical protein
MQWPVTHVFMKREEAISHFWGTELSGNHVDTLWPYWNLMSAWGRGLRPPLKRRVRISRAQRSC